MSKSNKQIIKESITNKNNIKKYDGMIREFRNIKKSFEVKIIEIMENLELDELEIECDEQKKTLCIDRKMKKETLTKKKIITNCLELCNGDDEKTNGIMEFLYDKNAREKIQKTVVKYDFKKNKIDS